MLRAMILRAVMLACVQSTMPVWSQDAETIRAAADRHFEAQEWMASAAKYREYVALSEYDGVAHYRLGYASLAMRDLEGAEKAFGRALELGQEVPSSSYNLACCFALRGRADEALSWLKAAVVAGQPIASAWGDPDLASLRSNPAFVEFMRKHAPNTALPPETRQFDFWIGDWVVRDPGGAVVGSNRISLVEGGSALLEEWRNSGGGTGTSLSYFDPANGQWHQVWVTPSSPASVASGGIVDGAMVLTSRDPAGKVTARTTWTPLEDGRVRQHWESTTDGGSSWSTVFDGYYERRLR